MLRRVLARLPELFIIELTIFLTLLRSARIAFHRDSLIGSAVSIAALNFSIHSCSLSAKLTLPCSCELARGRLIDS